MQELRSRDVYWTLRRLPRRVVSLMEEGPALFLAGGFIRACVANEAPQDVDLFAPDAERAGLYARLLAGDKGAVWTSANAHTVRHPDFAVPVQVIHRWAFDSPERCVESFDFTVAKAAVWGTGVRDPTTHRPGWRSTAHDDFYADLAARRLVYTSPKRNEDAGGSMLRVLKFYQRGYRMPLDSLAAVTARLVGGAAARCDITALDGSTYREDAVAEALLALLHEVDPVQDPHHLFHLPSSAEDAAPSSAP